MKFEGSLGKLSITSVHHPRQIMDFTTPETDNKVNQSDNKQVCLDSFSNLLVFLQIGDLLIDL